MNEVGKELKRLRLKKGWTQAQLAVYAESSQPTVNQIESGVRNPSTRTLEKLAGALEVEVGDLFPKGQPPLLLDDGAGDRSLRYLRAWRAFAWNLALDWGEKPPQTSREITPLLTAITALVNEGVFEDTNADDTSSKGELSLFRKAIKQLNKIADDVESDEVAAELRASLTLIPNPRDQIVA
jgi:transcriptional regulator with XRE-family HTH domain